MLDKKIRQVTVIFLTLCFLLAFSNSASILNHALAIEGEKVWGTPLQDMTMNIVSETTSIPSGNWSYVVRKQAVDEAQINIITWNAMTQGDMNRMRLDIESQVPNSQVTWIRISWTNARLVILPNGMNIVYVSGFQIEAIVQNIGSSSTAYHGSGGYQLAHSVKPTILWTPALIIATIAAIAWLATLIALIIWGTWMLWLVTNAIGQLPSWLSPWVMIGFGLLVLGGIGVLLYFFLGGKVDYKGKKREFKLGRQILFFSRG